MHTESVPILMCRPAHFAVNYAINPWMDPQGWERDRRKLAAAARRQWAGLHRALLGTGALIKLVPPVAGLPDLVFTANAAVVLDGKALLANFRFAQRQPERARYETAFRVLQSRGLIDTISTLPDGMTLEGAGDCVWDTSRNLFWIGYGPRSDASARAVVESEFGVEAVALELVDRRFYHMDTALCPLPRGEVMYVPEAFSASGLTDIHQRVEPAQRIAIDIEDATMLAANAICLGNEIILSACSTRLRGALEERGYGVVTTPLDAFLRSGGSASCLHLRLDHRSAPLSLAVKAA